MVTVPSFILRRLYVKGSMHNTAEGLEFSLCNKLGPGYARKLMPVIINGEPAAMEQSYFCSDGTRHSFQDVSDGNPFSLALNKTTVVSIEGHTLGTGPQTIGMSFEVPGMGTLKFDFTDVVTDG